MTAEFCTMNLQEILNVVCDQCPGINCKNCTYEQVINYASKCIRYVEEKELRERKIPEEWNANSEIVPDYRDGWRLKEGEQNERDQ